MVENSTKKSDSNPKDPFIDFDLEKIYTGFQTEKAIQVRLNDKEGWFPKSQIKDLGNGKVRVPKWLYFKVKNQNVEGKSSNSGQPINFEAKKEEGIKEYPKETELMMKSNIEFNQAIFQGMIQTLDKLVQDNNKFLNKLIQSNEENLNKIVQLINDLVLALLTKDDVSSEEKSLDENSEKIIESIEKDLNPQMILPGSKKTTKVGDIS